MFIRTRLSKYSISWIEFLDYKHKQDNIFVLINIFLFLFTNKKLVNIKNNSINMWLYYAFPKLVYWLYNNFNVFPINIYDLT